MSPRKSRNTILVVMLIAVGFVTLAPTPAPAQSPEQHRVYLPQLAIGNEFQSVFGLEMHRLDAARGLELISGTRTRWIRRNGLRWKDVEPRAGEVYTWDSPAVQELEQEMKRASELGINLVLAVRGSPTWAVTPYSADCAPINPIHYEAFGRFLAALVTRYSAPPYNLRYLEIGNEPDAPLRGQDDVFGCWGDERDSYYGGGAYGNMLRVVVPAIRAANPAVRVLNGGLLLDQPYVEGQSTTRLGRFFEGVLRSGGGPYIDIISFHTYVFWRTPGQPPLGPREDWRIAYLQNLLRDYDLPPKAMMRTETALLCIEVTPECRWAQADLVARTYARSMRDQLLATIWYVYDNDSFHNTALIEPRDVFVPRPAYFAYRHAARELNNALYEGPIPDLPPIVEGYRFRRDGGSTYVYWTDEPGGAPFTLRVRQGARVVCTDRDGGPLPCAPEGELLNLVAQVSPAFVTVR